MNINADELDQVDRCTCRCDTCRKVRPECACSGGPVGTASGACTFHGDY